MNVLLKMALESLWPIIAYAFSFWPFTYLKARFAQNLRKPENNRLAGYVMTQLLEAANILDEQLAVEKCQLQPSDQVLEVGFGPGLGLKEAVKLVKKSEGGKVYGADYSQSMVDVASSRLKKDISEDLVELHLASVAELPFDNHQFNKIYHCNVYYFWDDCVGCCSELLRVLKPGGLMITIYEIAGVSKAVNAGLLRRENVDVDNYMISLQDAGFVNVCAREYRRCETLFCCISANAKAS